jgi:hypothetical protein
LKPERGDVGPRGHLDVADLDVVEPVGDDLPERLLRVDAARGLVDVVILTVSPTLTTPSSGLLMPDDRLEQRGLADAVGADDPDDAVARQRERQARR